MNRAEVVFYDPPGTRGEPVCAVAGRCLYCGKPLRLEMKGEPAALVMLGLDCGECPEGDRAREFAQRQADVAVVS